MTADRPIAELNQTEVDLIAACASGDGSRAAVGVLEALATRLRDAAQTAQNDDLSKPQTEKRERHIIRVEAMLDAAEHFEELATPSSPSPCPKCGRETCGCTFSSADGGGK